MSKITVVMSIEQAHLLSSAAARFMFSPGLSSDAIEELELLSEMLNFATDEDESVINDFTA